MVVLLEIVSPEVDLVVAVKDIVWLRTEQGEWLRSEHEVQWLRTEQGELSDE